MEERRNLERKHLAFFTRIFDRKTGQLIGHLADLTADGMMVIGEKPLDIDEIYQLQMELSITHFGKEFLEFSSRSIWCRPDIDPDYFNTGFQHLDLSADDIHVIRLIIEEYGIRH